MKASPPIQEDFLRTPVEYDAPKPKTHLFLWTVFLLLLVGFSMACWIGSYLVFSRPEIPLSYKILRKIKKIDLPQRFKVQAPPPGEFLSPEQIYNRFNALKPSDLRTLNAELERNYLRNYPAANESVPYVKGRFTILDSYELGAGDFVTSGVVTLAVASDYPKLLIEHLYSASANVAPIIKRNLRTGMDIELRRTYELTAVLHVYKQPGGRIQLTVVPLNYGSYVFSGADGGFSLDPPTELNVSAGWPVVRGARYEEADQAYVNYRTHGGMGPLVGYHETEKKPETVVKGVDPTPEPAPTATPAPSVQVAQVTPAPGKGPPAAKKPGASPTPALLAQNDTPIPRAMPVTPTPAAVVKASDRSGVSLQPFLDAPSANDTPGTAAPTPRAEADNTKSWQTYAPGQQPVGRSIRIGDVTAFNQGGGLNGGTVYLHGQFTVRAVGVRKALGIKNVVLRSPAESNVRVIVEYPSTVPLPAQGAEVARDEQRPFQITRIEVTPDSSAPGGSTLNVYAREIMD